MKPTIHCPASRLAPALALVAGVWLIPSPSTPGVEVVSPPGAAAGAAEPDRIHLAQADAVPAETPVSYAPDQADRGEERFQSECEECHGDDLRGGLVGGPPLRGVNFEQKYANGLPASVMYAFMSSTMPPNAPGRLSPSAYADLMAYILKQNGFAAGAPLPSDLDALDHLLMQK